MGRLIFITGAVRSGKSSFAIKLAKESNKQIVFLASCNPLDEEMKKRVKRHRQQRPKTWKTVEEPIEVAAVIEKAKKNQLIIFDCLTLWISNILLKDQKQTLIKKRIIGLIEVLKHTPATVLVVSNEVGWGVVPENKLARSFRDIVGITHQQIAKVSDEVYLIVAGQQLKLKGGSDGKNKKNN